MENGGVASAIDRSVGLQGGTVLVLDSTEQAFGRGLAALLDAQGYRAIAPSQGQLTSEYADITDVSLVVCDEGLAPVVCAETSDIPHVILVSVGDAETARRLVGLGAAAMLERRMAEPVLLAGIAAALAGLAVLPSLETLSGVSRRLATPPIKLEEDEETFLTHALSKSIESAGHEMGWSRRQAQRRFRALCERLAIKNHIHAAYLAGRWGLLEE